MNILIVDDIATNRKLLRVSLEAEGHRALEAADGVEALAVLARETVDAVISDILMPNMDGFRLCREIRKSEKHRSLPFIVYTSTYNSPEDVALAQTIGADRYLTKPAPFESLLQAVRQAVAASEARSGPPPPEDEAYVLKQYSSALVNKLEEKNSELKGTVEALERAHERIVELNSDLERRVAERTAELTRTSARLQNILDSATHVSIVATTTEGVITLFSSGAERMLGYSAAEMIGRETPALFHLASEIARRGEELTAELGRPVQGFAVFTEIACRVKREERDWTYVRKDGTTLTVTLVVSPKRNAQGGVRGFLGVATDVTAQNRLRTELVAANRGLETKNHEIQNFYHTLSHELKTPLTSTREFIALVADGVAGPVNEGQAEYLGLAVEGCDQLTVCINDLLDATRLETGKMTIQLKPGSLGQVVKRVLAGLKHAAAEKNISLREDVAADLPEVLMDDARMSQIITNLVNNALKFTPDHGRIEVSVRESASHPEWLEVTVSDSGRGIAQDQLERIFDRLYQIKNGDAATEQGVGLGLYLCRELVGLHGGDLRVESDPGKGSRFTFTIPEPGALRRPRVLVIEDDPVVSACTRRILEEGGFEALTASSGQEGLELLEDYDPMVAVIDLQMPGLDGADILKAIRQRYGALPVIVHTGDPEGELMTRALEFSPFTVLVKPCPAGRLLETVRRLKGQADTQFWRRHRLTGPTDLEHSGQRNPPRKTDL